MVRLSTFDSNLPTPICSINQRWLRIGRVFQYPRLATTEAVFILLDVTVNHHLKMGESMVSLNLLIDTNANKVLFAEAGKDFVDFLFHIFSLPLETVVQLDTTKGMVGSLGNLAKSIHALNSNYFLPNVTKESVLQPLVSTTSVNLPLLNLLPKSSNDTNSLYGCSSKLSSACATYVTYGTGAVCPQCEAIMSTPMINVKPKSLTNTSSSAGYVKGIATYIVMDNLEVTPLSVLSSINLINNNVKDISSLVEKQVLVSLDEGIAIIKASLKSQAVLTAVFLGNKDVAQEMETKKTTRTVPDMVYGAMTRAYSQKAIDTETYRLLAYMCVDRESDEYKTALRAYIDHMKMKIYLKYNGFVTPLEKVGFVDLLYQVEDWLFDVSEEETKIIYITNLEELYKRGKRIEEMCKEYMELEAVIELFIYYVNSYKEAAMSNDPKFDHIDSSEKEKVLKVCIEARLWLKEKRNLRDDNPYYVTRFLTRYQVSEKAEKVGRLCRPIMTKPRLSLPKPRKLERTSSSDDDFPGIRPAYD